MLEFNTPNMATPPNPSLADDVASYRLPPPVQPPHHHHHSHESLAWGTPQPFGSTKYSHVNTAHHVNPNSAGGCQPHPTRSTPHHMHASGRLGQATPQMHESTHDHINPNPNHKRNRTHHSTEDTTQMASRMPMMVVQRGASRHSNGPGTSSGRPSLVLSHNMQAMRISNSASMERDGRPSLGAMSFSSGCNNTTGHQNHINSLASSPQCAYPQASATSPHFDDRHGSLSLGRNFDYMENECSQAETDFSTFVAKRILTEFREIRELGHGHYGHVLLCEEMNSGDYVAIKISNPLQARELNQARRERDIMNALRGSPHIVHLYNSWEEGKHPQMHLQMQYCSNGTVAQAATRRRESRSQWSEYEILSFLGQMAIALDAMHSINVAHGDLKPENILIDGCGQYVLSDFGCSLTLDDHGRPRDPTAAPAATASNNQFHFRTLLHSGAGGNHNNQVAMSQDEGDKRYIALDMINEREHFKAGDMFSLGMSLYELMSGYGVPLQGDHYQFLRSRTELSELLQAGYSEPLVNLVLRLLSRDATLRPSAREVLEFPALRVDDAALGLQQCSARELATHLAHGSVPADAFLYHQACFEVSHYLLAAVFRDHRNAYPASVRRLWRGPSVSVGASVVDSTPLRPGQQNIRMSQGTVHGAGESVSTAFRTPITKRVE